MNDEFNQGSVNQMKNEKSQKMPLLAELGAPFSVVIYKDFAPMGLTDHSLWIRSAANFKRRRRRIFVVIKSKRKSKPRRGVIFCHLINIRFENITRVVIHVKFFQKLNVFLAKGFFA